MALPVREFAYFLSRAARANRRRCDASIFLPRLGDRPMDRWIGSLGLSRTKVQNLVVMRERGRVGDLRFAKVNYQRRLRSSIGRSASAHGPRAGSSPNLMIGLVRIPRDDDRVPGAMSAADNSRNVRARASISRAITASSPPPAI